MAEPSKAGFMENTMVHSVDERKGCRSLLCDASGIIIAEMVYRCMVCYSIHDFIGDVSKHYHTVHMNDGDEEIEEMTNEEEQDQSNRTTTNNNKSNLSAVENNNKKNSNHLHKQSNTTTTTTTTVNSNNTTTSNIDNNNNYLSDHSNNCDDSWEIDDKLKSNSQRNHIRVNNIQSNISDNTYANSPNPSESCTRSGYIHCPVCSNVRCYTTLQRRYGQFTCVACYRFFKEFFLKPIRFSCPFLGQCPLDVKSKCKACWILACTKIYSVDDRRKSILQAYAPIKGETSKIVSPSSPFPSVIINYHNENAKPFKSSHNRTLTSSQSSALSHSKTPDETRSFNNNPSIEKETSNFDFSPNSRSTTGQDNFPSTIVLNESSTATTSNNNVADKGDDYMHNSELASLSALNMLNILTCEEAVPDCDELLEEIAEDYNSLDSQLNQSPPQKMIKLDPDDDPQDNVNSNANLSARYTAFYIDDEVDEQSSSTTVAPTATPTTTTTGLFQLIENPYCKKPNETTVVPTITGTPTSVIKSKPDRRSKVRVKNWCCLKCANCLADDCGKCINCLDRPKFGGPFVRKQRCVNKKCLEKIQPDQPK